MLLLAAERALKESEAELDDSVVDESEALDDRLRHQWEKHLEAARHQLDEAAGKQRGPEPEHLSDALLLLGSWVSSNCRRGRDGAVVLNVNGEPRCLYFLHDVHPRSIAARLRRWVESTETRVVLREKWRDFPTTWHAVQRLADEFVIRPGACLVWVSREDVARLLALRSFVMQARSHDVVGPTGESVPDQLVVTWLRQVLDPAHWAISTDMTQPLKNDSPRTVRSRELPALDSEDSPATLRDSVPPSTVMARSASLPLSPQTSRDELPNSSVTQSQPGPGSSVAVNEGTRALRVLEHLRVASLDRLIREAAVVDTWVTRKIVVSELEKLGSRVRWFGRAIVALAAEDPP
jgi:hypothetical protein